MDGMRGVTAGRPEQEQLCLPCADIRRSRPSPSHCFAMGPFLSHKGRGIDQRGGRGMHPALSIIIFTTASGAGYGLLALLGLLASLGLLPPDRLFGFVALALALGAVTGGLVSSAAHLGHPERALRAFSQWRSSWLSR